MKESKKQSKRYCRCGNLMHNVSPRQHPKYKGASRKGGAAKSRSKTFSGIAAAMAEQWGGIEE